MNRPNRDSAVERIDAAVQWMTAAHAGQTRRCGDVPYSTHPATVALLLAQHGFADESLLVAALLHDVVEDSSTTAAEIGERFGASVQAIVVALSEVKNDADGNRLSWGVRKTEHLARLATAPAPVIAVALADKLHNVCTMSRDLSDRPELWSAFHARPRRILWYYESMLQIAWNRDEFRDSSLTTAYGDAVGKLRSLVDRDDPLPLG